MLFINSSIAHIRRKHLNNRIAQQHEMMEDLRQLLDDAREVQALEATVKENEKAIAAMFKEAESLKV